MGRPPRNWPVTLNASGVATFTTTALSLAVTRSRHPTPGHSFGHPPLRLSPGCRAGQRDGRSDVILEPILARQSVTFTATVAPVASHRDTNRNGDFPGRYDHPRNWPVTLNASGVATFTTRPSPSAATRSRHPTPGIPVSRQTHPSPYTGGKPGRATVGLTSILNPSSLDQSVTFTATVAAVAPATGTPTGTVTFLDGTTTLGTGP